MAEQNPEIVEELSEIMKNIRTESEVFTFDAMGYYILRKTMKFFKIL